MKKILFVLKQLRCNFDGASKILTMLANSLKKSGYDVYCYAYSGILENENLLPDVHCIRGTENKKYNTVRELGKTLRTVKPDVAVSFITNANTFLSLAAVGTKIPVIVCERSDPFLETNKQLVVMRQFYRLASGAVFQTAEAQKYYTWIKNSVVIANPIEKTEIRVIKKFADREDTVVAVSRIDLHQKRLDLMIEAFSILAPKYPQLKLKIYGDGEPEDCLIIKKMISQYGLENRVVLAGKIKNVKETIVDCKMYILTSDYEGIPNSLLEAMSIGLPVISTDCSPGGAKLLINHMENGILVQRGDVNAVANAMEYYMEHPSEADKFGAKAQKVNERFSADKIINEWMNYINSFISE